MGSSRALSVEEFERIAPLLDSPSALIKGKLHLMSPTNYRHGTLTAKIARILDTYLDAHPDLGEVVGAETGFRIANPDYPVQAPDAGFIRAARIPQDDSKEDSPIDHFMIGAPDLAVEVRSPSERPAAVHAKAVRWLDAGSEEVWILDGKRGTVMVFRQGCEPQLLHAEDVLTSPELLPGFSFRISDIFMRRVREEKHCCPGS